MPRFMRDGINRVEFDNTRFIFNTNFEGDPRKDNYGSSERKGNVIIPDANLAMDLRDSGFNVRTTKPRPGYEEDFVPEYYIAIKLNFNTIPGRRPPHVVLVAPNGAMVPLDEESVKKIDDLQRSRSIRNVRVQCNMRFNDDNRNTLYISHMYVEQEMDDDPYAKYYRKDDADSAPWND